MAKKISQLSTGSTPTGAELIEVVQGGNSRKLTAQEIADLSTGGGGVSDWGDITGTLSDQTDLQDALDAKQDDITFGTGVQTALGVNVGSAGAPVVNGGALGTPSSGTATNLTGTASGLTAGNVTTNANLTGDITSTGNATTIASGVIVDADVNASAAIAGTKIANTPAGNIAATTVQAAINELDTEKAPLASPTFTGTVTLPAGTIPKIIQVAFSDTTSAITASAGKVAFRMPYSMTVTAVRASLKTAQASGSIFTVDINEGASSILSTKLTIDNTEKTSTTAASPPVISDTALADDAEITIDVDQVGDGTAVGGVVSIIGY